MALVSTHRPSLKFSRHSATDTLVPRASAAGSVRIVRAAALGDHVWLILLLRPPHASVCHTVNCACPVSLHRPLCFVTRFPFPQQLQAVSRSPQHTLQESPKGHCPPSSSCSLPPRLPLPVLSRRWEWAKSLALGLGGQNQGASRAGCRRYEQKQKTVECMPGSGSRPAALTAGHAVCLNIPTKLHT